MFTWDVLEDIAKHANMLLKITEPCSNPEFPQQERQNYQARKIFVFLRGPTIWKVVPKSVWNDIVN